MVSEYDRCGFPKRQIVECNSGNAGSHAGWNPASMRRGGRVVGLRGEEATSGHTQKHNTLFFFLPKMSHGIASSCNVCQYTFRSDLLNLSFPPQSQVLPLGGHIYRFGSDHTTTLSLLPPSDSKRPFPLQCLFLVPLTLTELIVPFPQLA